MRYPHILYWSLSRKMSLSIFLNIAILVTVTSAEIPPYIKVCGRRNPNLDQCIINSVEDLLGILKDGIPELNVPSLEPVYIDEVKLADLSNLKASARNVKLFGLSAFKVNDLKIDLKKQQIDVAVTFDKVKLLADYDVNAKILVNIAGTGPINIVAMNVDARATMKYEIIQHKRKEYMFFSSMNTKISIKDYDSKFTPRGDSNSTLATAINAALQNSRPEIIHSTTPHLERKITEEMLDLANKICKSFTYDELFPDRE